ncbi:hypothetical protein EDD22DRAFT_852434 [Suillus occidentalis]|nr:hypothetical protein EDD22DRAFT_852434 [Suillus occidentalis]
MSASQHDSGNPQSQDVVSLSLQTSPDARAKQKIATLLEDIEILKQDKATKNRKTTYYVSQGRAIRRMVILYNPIEDLVKENDRRCEETNDDSTVENSQDCLQRSYIELSKVLPWLHEKLAKIDNEESEDMIKKLKRGMDSARGDDTGTLKDLVATWVNVEYSPIPLIMPGDKHHRGFVNNACGKLLCPVEWHWEDALVKAGIRDRTTAFIVSENSWPSFMYENYTADTKNLERGLMKLKLLLMFIASQGFKWMVKVMALIFLRITDAPKDDQTMLRHAKGDSSHDCVHCLPDFFEHAPGPAAQARVRELLEWWTRKVFGRNHRQDLTQDVISQMSVSALAVQRQQMEDATFDSN